MFRARQIDSYEWNLYRFPGMVQFPERVSEEKRERMKKGEGKKRP